MIPKLEERLFDGDEEDLLTIASQVCYETSADDCSDIVFDLSSFKRELTVPVPMTRRA